MWLLWWSLWRLFFVVGDRRRGDGFALVVVEVAVVLVSRLAPWGCVPNLETEASEHTCSARQSQTTILDSATWPAVATRHANN